MKLDLIKTDKVVRDITQLVTRITWSGEFTNVARKLEVDMAHSPSDYYLPKVVIDYGDMVRLWDDEGKELFRGIVFTKEKSYNSDTLKFICFDNGIYLKRNKGAYNFKNMTPEGMVAKICSDFGITLQYAEQTNVKLSRIAVGEDLYTMIMKGYSYASASLGELYIPIFIKGKLNIIPKGAICSEIVLENKANLRDSTFSGTIENMVNQVVIVDKDGNKKGEVKNDEWIKAFGRMQEVYSIEEGKNSTEMAEKLLKGVEEKASIEVSGNIDYRTGFAVFVNDEYTGLTGLFYIDADEHTWENGDHITRLTLSFENIMDLKDVEDVAKKVEKSKKGKKGKKQSIQDSNTFKIKLDY